MADTESTLTPAELVSDPLREVWRPMAKAMYEAYGEAVTWKAVSGHPMPPFSDVGRRVEGAWIMAAIKALNVNAQPRTVK